RFLAFRRMVRMPLEQLLLPLFPAHAPGPHARRTAGRAGDSRRGDGRHTTSPGGLPGRDRGRLATDRPLDQGRVGGPASLAGPRSTWRDPRGVDSGRRLRTDRYRMGTVQYHGRAATRNARRDHHRVPPREGEAVVAAHATNPGGWASNER